VAVTLSSQSLKDYKYKEATSTLKPFLNAEDEKPKTKHISRVKSKWRKAGVVCRGAYDYLLAFDCFSHEIWQKVAIPEMRKFLYGDLENLQFVTFQDHPSGHIRFTRSRELLRYLVDGVSNVYISEVSEMVLLDGGYRTSVVIKTLRKS